MDQMHAIASIETGAISTRWGLVDLFLSVMRADQEGLELQPRGVMDFFLKFEDERRSAAVALADLRSTVADLSVTETEEELKIEMPDLAPDMLVYVNAFAREGATKENVASRSNVMFERLRSHVETADR